ncbi:MAG: TIGR02757 family protein [Candidatus Hydrogenedentales bacterium]
MTRQELHGYFDQLYEEYNRRAFVHPDPLEVVYRFDVAADREIAGLIAATLAYGRVAQILRNLDTVFDALGPSPREAISVTSEAEWKRCLRHFRHRWTTGAEVAALLAGVRRVLERHGAIETCFARHYDRNEGNTLCGLRGLVAELGGPSSLLSDPTKASACKRLHLYLRWMVRRDDVDPGCWTAVAPAHLIVPLDTHLHRIARRFGFTRRKQAGLAAARDVTRVFGKMNPDDPLRYDFVLTRFGIRSDLELKDLFARRRPAA